MRSSRSTPTGRRHLPRCSGSTARAAHVNHLTPRLILGWDGSPWATTAVSGDRRAAGRLLRRRTAGPWRFVTPGPWTAGLPG
ncbi:DUF6087 family protein [Kitasatospora sp. NPDC056138]|uniref:DUF6087 family protein n=1 Tax=Kitasatospora sp. NPDC056138 TaxID=3345724 RepID=UPI0035E290F1